jgi:hypothetical protein
MTAAEIPRGCICRWLGRLHGWLLEARHARCRLHGDGARAAARDAEGRMSA